MSSEELLNQEHKIIAQTFVNSTLNQLIAEQRETIHANSMQIFFLGEAFAYTLLKSKIDQEGIITQESFDRLLSAFLEDADMSKYLEPLLKEYHANLSENSLEEVIEEETETNICEDNNQISNSSLEEI